MGRKILCPSCGSILNEEILKQKNSQNVCLVCGANLSDDEPESTPEEELVTWYYYDLGGGTYYLDDVYSEDDENSHLVYMFKAPKSLKAAKKVLRREYDPDAFLKSKSSNANKPDAFWIAEGKCPRCHSDNIQLVPRKWSIWTGYRTNAVSRICLNCKHRF